MLRERKGKARQEDEHRRPGLAEGTHRPAAEEGAVPTGAASMSSSGLFAFFACQHLVSFSFPCCICRPSMHACILHLWFLDLCGGCFQELFHSYVVVDVTKTHAPFSPPYIWKAKKKEKETARFWTHRDLGNFVSSLNRKWRRRDSPKDSCVLRDGDYGDPCKIWLEF